MRTILIFSSLLLSVCITYAQDYISKSQAEADIDSLVAVIKAVHYNPYLFIDSSVFHSKADSIKASLSDSVTKKDFLENLYILTASLQDGHTQPGLMQPAFATDLKKPQFLAVAFLSDDQNNLYVKESAATFSAIPTASKIISVNGKNIAAIKKSAENYIGGLTGWKKEFTDRLFPYFLYLNGIIPPFQIIYEHGGEKNKVTIDEGVNFVSSVALSLPSVKQPSYSFKIINNKVGYLDFIAMSGDFGRFMNYLDSAFAQMRMQGIKHFAIDLRNNSGGNSTFGDILLSFITPKPFALSGKKYWKVSQQYKAYLLSHGDTASKYHSYANGEVWRMGNCGPKEKLVNVDSVFDGNVYILTGPFTFSSANMLADGAKQYKLATIIGEPTGESTNDFGEVYSFKLPNSQLVMNVTTSFDLGADCDPSHYNPVMPDKMIKWTYDDLLKTRDPLIEHILKEASGM